MNNEEVKGAFHFSFFSHHSSLSYLLAAFVSLATGNAWAADCYWSGGTSSDWGTVANWTTGGKVPTNDGAFFRQDKFNNSFKNGDRANLVTFGAAHTNKWRTYFNNCGSASAPIVLRGNDATHGLTSGDSSDSNNREGIYIGTNKYYNNRDLTDNKASTGNAYVRFETGTFATGPNSYWYLGNSTYNGYMTVAGATINSLLAFYLNRGSLTVDSGTVSIGRDLHMGTDGNATLTMNDGTLTMGAWLRFESSNYAKTINLNGGVLRTATVANIGGSGAKTVIFNGGTLKNSYVNSSHSLIGSGITVTVNAGGGTVDSGNNAISIGAAIADASDVEGAMTFKGGNTITLNGANTYTGGTTIELGTKVKTGNESAKDAVVGKLIVDCSTYFVDTSDIVVFEYSAGGLSADNVTLLNCGERHVAVCPLQFGRCGLHTEHRR